MADDGGFLRRWSRRKHEARQGPEPESAAAPTAEPEESGAEASGAETPEREAAGRADDARRGGAAGEHAGPAAAAEPDCPVVPPQSLPDIASLGAESDFRAFMRPGVPPELRNQALRRLWRVKPLVRNPERLVEYDDDYTDAARVAKGLRTLYRVGRGVFTDAELAALDADREGAPAAADDPGADATAGAGDPTAPSADEQTRDAAAGGEGLPAPAGGAGRDDRLTAGRSRPDPPERRHPDSNDGAETHAAPQSPLTRS